MELRTLDQMAKDFRVDAGESMHVLQQSKSILILPFDDKRSLPANALHFSGYLYYRKIDGPTIEEGREVYAPTPAGYALLNKRS